MTRSLCLVLIAACVACDAQAIKGIDPGTDTGEADTDSDSDADSDTDTDTDSDSDTLGDPWTDANVEDTNECDEFEDYEIPGAVTWWVGEYEHLGDGDYSGSLTWMFYSNPAWVESGEVEGDCRIVWNAFVSTRDAESCTSCDFGVDFILSLDHEETDCPAGLWSAYEDAEDHLDVDVGGSGEADFYWSSSGDLFAVGRAEESGFWYVAGPTCSWF